MDIVIPWLLAWAYPLIGTAVTVYAARSHARQKPGDLPWSTGAGLLAGAGWPVGLLYWLTLNHLRKEEDQRKAESRQEMTLETAHQVIARHEAKRALDRKLRNDRLRRDWEKLAREALPQREARGWSRPTKYDITDFNN
jgi:hypothetical protein